MYLLGFSWQSQQDLWTTIERGVPELLPLDVEDVPRIRELMTKYRDLPVDLADAAPVRLAERERIPPLFTLDRRDVTVHRPSGIGRFSIVPRDTLRPFRRA